MARNTVTQEMLILVVANIESSRRKLGIDPELVAYDLQTGSKANGIAFRLFGHRAGETGLSHVSVVRDGMGYIGSTKTEAYETLQNVNAALAAAVDALNL